MLCNSCSWIASLNNLRISQAISDFRISLCCFIIFSVFHFSRPIFSPFTRWCFHIAAQTFTLEWKATKHTKGARSTKKRQTIFKVFKEISWTKIKKVEEVYCINLLVSVSEWAISLQWELMWKDACVTLILYKWRLQLKCKVETVPSSYLSD